MVLRCCPAVVSRWTWRKTRTTRVDSIWRTGPRRATLFQHDRFVVSGQLIGRGGQGRLSWIPGYFLHGESGREGDCGFPCERAPSGAKWRSHWWRCRSPNFQIEPIDAAGALGLLGCAERALVQMFDQLKRASSRPRRHRILTSLRRSLTERLGVGGFTA